MRDPYQAPQADLREPIGAPRWNGSVLAAVSVGAVLWGVLYSLSGIVLLHSAGNSTLSGTARGGLHWLSIGTSAVSHVIVFFVSARIAHGREWLAAAMLFALRVAVSIGITTAVMRTGFDLSWASVTTLAALAVGATAGTLAGIGINREREKKAVVQ
ncbi:MAG TPA: hypothetical protein VF798_09705 [Burkholderiaceae bacterium]